MNRYTLILIFLFSLMFSSPSYSEWTKIGKGGGSGNRGVNFYVDYETIRKVDGYVYFWRMKDRSKPKYGNLSSKVHVQGDCKLFRIKRLSFSYHKEPMGGGTGRVDNVPDENWRDPHPNSANERLLKDICSR